MKSLQSLLVIVAIVLVLVLLAFLAGWLSKERSEPEYLGSGSVSSLTTTIQTSTDTDEVNNLDTSDIDAVILDLDEQTQTLNVNDDFADFGNIE